MWTGWACGQDNGRIRSSRKAYQDTAPLVFYSFTPVLFNIFSHAPQDTYGLFISYKAWCGAKVSKTYSVDIGLGRVRPGFACRCGIRFYF